MKGQPTKLTIALSSVALWGLLCGLEKSVAQGALEETVSIRGSVVNAVTGRPIVGATVQGVTPRLETDSEGRFQITGVPRGVRRLIATKPGYLRLQDSSITLPASHDSATNVALKLLPEAILTGRVFDPSGNPVVRATVISYSREYIGGKRQLTEASRNMTNDRGEYRVIGLMQGEYFVRIIPPPTPRLLERASPVLSATFYPSGSDLSQMPSIVVRAGEETRLRDISLDTSSLGWIHAKVLNGTGEAVPPNSSIVPILRHSDFATFSYADLRTSESRDTFSFRPDALGTYVLSTQWTAADGRLARGVASVDFRGNDLTVSITVTKSTSSIAGRVFINHDRENTQESLQGVTIVLADATATVESQASKQDGTFQIALDNGQYAVVTARGLPAGSYVSHARQGAIDVLTGGLTVSENTQPLQIGISKSTGKVEGQVQNQSDKPSSNALVALIPAGSLKQRSDKLGFYRYIFADLNGAFAMDQVPPGEYDIVAWSSCTICYFTRSPAVAGGAYMDELFMREFIRRAERLTVSNDNTFIRLQAIEADR